MALTVTHPFVCALADDPVADAAGEVVPSDWNADHTINLVSLLDGDGSQVLVTKNTNVDNADNSDLRISAHAYDVNPISGRWNQVYRLGYNMAETGPGYDAGEPSMGIQWESFYEQGGAELLEWHQSVFKSSDNSELRFESWAIDRATYEISKLVLFDDMTWYLSDETKTATFSWDGTAFSIYFPNTHNSTLKFDKNNYASLVQRNAADSAYLSLPYIGSDDRLICGTPAVFTGAIPSSGAYSGSFVHIQASSAASNNNLLRVVGPTMVGAALNGISIEASVAWEFTAKIYNTNGSGTCARWLADAVAGSCDPISVWRVVGVTSFCAGIDNSDSDSFVIAKNDSPGTNNALRIDTSLNSRFYGNLGIANATNGQACEIKTLTELLTIAAAATSTTTIQKPANSIILAVPVRVTTAVTCTSTFTVGDAGSATRFSTAAVSKAANTTDKGTAAGAYYNATAEGIVITPDTVPSDATGRVRVTIYYIELTPPTS